MPSSQPSAASHTTLYRNGRIFTASASTPWADTLVCRAGKFLAVGTESTVKQALPISSRASTQVIDLGGRFVMPGFCDSHIHLYETILTARSVNLAGCHDLPEMLARLAAHAEQTPTDGWLRGQGWNESRWPTPTYPTRADLDHVTGPHRPAILWRSDMHVAICNTAALNLAQVTAATPNPPGGDIARDASGAPTGILYDTAIDLVSTLIPPLTGNQLESGIQEAASRLHRLGITAIHDQRLQNGHDGPRMLAAYTDLHARGALPLRVHCNLGGAYLDHALALGLRSGFGDEWLRIGHIKYFIDGSLGSRTAWMLEPYSSDGIDHNNHPAPDSGNARSLTPEPDRYGLCVTSPANLRAEFSRAMAGGLAISVHAIGDRGIREVLDIFEELLPAHSPPPIPHRIEHVQILNPADLPRLAAMNLTASVQPIHALDDIEIARRHLGDRGRWTYALRALADQGTRLAFGSDAPVADPNPLLGLHAAVQRTRPGGDPTEIWYPEQGVDLTQALHAYTLGPAQAVGIQHLGGSLEAGKCADFVVLSHDPFARLTEAGSQANLAEIAIHATILGGVPVYDTLMHQFFTHQPD